jgi:hypothetical protein
MEKEEELNHSNFDLASVNIYKILELLEIKVKKIFCLGQSS